MRAIGFRGVERLRVGVGDEELDPLHVRPDHVGDGVAARAADADDTDPRAKFVDFRPDEINAHGTTPSTWQRVEPWANSCIMRVPTPSKKCAEVKKVKI